MTDASDGELSAIAREYLKLTPGSAALMQRAARSMPYGITRTLSWFAPYPVVFERGAGSIGIAAKVLHRVFDCCSFLVFLRG